MKPTERFMDIIRMFVKILAAGWNWIGSQFSSLFLFIVTRWLLMPLVVALAIGMVLGFDPVAMLLGHMRSGAAMGVTSVAFVAVGYFVLDEGASSFVNHAQLLASKTKKGRQSGVFVLVVAFGTAATEFGLTLACLVEHQPGVLYSSITTSDMFNPSLVVGLCIVLATSSALAFNGRAMWSAMLWLLGATLLVAYCGWHGFTPELAASICIFCALAVWRFMRTTPKDKEASPDDREDSSQNEVFNVSSFVLGFLWLVIGAIMFYDGTIALLDTPKFLSGLVAGFAASAPELATLLPLARHGKKSLTVIAAAAMASNAMDSFVAYLPGLFGWYHGVTPSHATMVQGASVLVATAIVTAVLLLVKQGGGWVRWSIGLPLLAVCVANMALLSL